MGVVVGMIGVGHPHSAMHLRTLGALDRVDGVVLCDEDSALRERVAGEFSKTVGSVGEVDELLRRPDIPIVLIALPNDRASEIITSAAGAGKHVLVEKPCARTLAEFLPAAAAVQRNRVKFGVFYTWRAQPAMLKIRELVRHGAIGRVTSAELRMVTTQVAIRNPSHWLFKKSVAGGGIASWLGCHWLDLLRYTTGQEIESVSALTANVGREAIDVEDVVSASLRLSGGGLASFYAGYLLAHGRPGYEGADYDRAFILRGTEGNLVHAEGKGAQQVTLESSAQTSGESHQVFTFTLPPSPAYGGAAGLAFANDFLDAALTGSGEGPAPVDAAQGVLAILDAIYASAESGRVVKVQT